MTLLGKALSGGFYQVSAVRSNNEVLGTLKPDQHGSTFDGKRDELGTAALEDGARDPRHLLRARLLPASTDGNTIDRFRHQH